MNKKISNSLLWEGLEEFLQFKKDVLDFTDEETGEVKNPKLIFVEEKKKEYTQTSYIFPFLND